MEGTLRCILNLLLLAVHCNSDAFPKYVQGPPRLVSYSIPDKRPLKKALGFIEDTYLNFTELTSKYKYPTEQHEVTTDDGYILTVFRILSKCNVPRQYPVVLMHGIYDSSDEWIQTGPKAGLGFILANNCYDIWAANHRGNVYSRKHKSLDPDRDALYWNYTFDEHGNYDLPAIIDYVLARTQRQKVNYIGHSQGTTDFFVMGSLKPEYNEKIRLSLHLSPIVYMKNIKSALPKFIAPKSREIRAFLENSGLSELLAKNHLGHFIAEFACQFAPEDICGTFYSLTTGYRRGNISPRNLAISFGHLLAGISAKDLAHLGQLITTGRFQRYDEGRKGNIKRYGKPKPPEYDLSKVSSPVVLVIAQSDWLSTLEDTEKLRSRLPNVVEYYVVPDRYWSHNDQVYGVKAPTLVFSRILKHLQDFNGT